MAFLVLSAAPRCFVPLLALPPIPRFSICNSPQFMCIVRLLCVSCLISMSHVVPHGARLARTGKGVGGTKGHPLRKESCGSCNLSLSDEGTQRIDRKLKARIRAAMAK